MVGTMPTWHYHSHLWQPDVAAPGAVSCLQVPNMPVPEINSDLECRMRFIYEFTRLARPHGSCSLLLELPRRLVDLALHTLMCHDDSMSLLAV